MLTKVVADKKILALLFSIIDSYNEREGVGIPMGNQTSQLFALFYLDKLDRLIKEKFQIKYYVRYMDDMIIICESKEKLRCVLEKMTQLVESELKLKFNQKTQIFPIKNGVDFLGFHLYMTETGKIIRKLRNSSKKRFKKRMKKLCEQINNGEKTMDDLKKVLPGFNGHMKRGDTWNFRKSVLSGMLFKLPSDTSDMKEFKDLISKSRNFALRTVDMYNVIKQQPDTDMQFAKETVKNAGETYLLLSEVLESGNSQQDIEFFLMTARKSAKAEILNLSYLKKSSQLTQKQFQSMNNDAKEILFLLRKILKKTEADYEVY